MGERKNYYMGIPRKKIAIALASLLVFLTGLANFGFLWTNLKYLARNRDEAYLNDTAGGKGGQQLFPANTLRIPGLDVTAPIVYVEEKSEQAFQEALKDGVVHYPGTAKPGELGNCYIFGHSSDYAWSKGNYKTVFALLPRIEKGAKIIATDQAGNSFTYTVTDSFVASPKDVYLLDQQDYKTRILTLQTSYPLGTALKRYIVRAEMR